VTKDLPFIVSGHNHFKKIWIMLLANLRVLSDYYKKIDATKEIIAHLFINLVTRKMKQLSHL